MNINYTKIASESFDAGLKAGQKIILEALLHEIRYYEYTKASEVKGAIHNWLERAENK